MVNVTIKDRSKRINNIIYSFIRPFHLLFKPKTVKNSVTSNRMISFVPIIGISKPEKVAFGQCPHCRARVFLWITEDGIELNELKDG